MAKQKFPTPSAPRTFEEISNDFSQLQFELGRQQYLSDLQAKTISRILDRMNRVDEEATARKNLDAEVAKAKKEETPVEEKQQ